MAATTTTNLKMNFAITDLKSISINLPDPVDGLTASEIEEFADEAVDNEAFAVNGAPITGLNYAEIIETTTDVLVDNRS